MVYYIHQVKENTKNKSEGAEEMLSQIEALRQVVEILHNTKSSERRNKCARICQARKRDTIIFESIKPFLNKEGRTADEIARLANKDKPWEERIKPHEIHSFFFRHPEVGVECIFPIE